MVFNIAYVTCVKSYLMALNVSITAMHLVIKDHLYKILNDVT